jgi:hypothetical protein
MNITITINTDNSAFCDIPEIEVARILTEIAEIFENNGLSEFSLTDFNGNNVGKIKITES